MPDAIIAQENAFWKAYAHGNVADRFAPPRRSFDFFRIAAAAASDQRIVRSSRTERRRQTLVKKGFHPVSLLGQRFVQPNRLLHRPQLFAALTVWIGAILATRPVVVACGAKR
jgi:hypothetical protein